ncbi:hypothetical protein QM012_008576 [Aureobasidium pullulans]|uniref:Uncharacterized protein n=1 Tax=Aureobasidium pullulans TaxID=5580 RepID=A0ABR0TJS4_AURPU
MAARGDPAKDISFLLAVAHNVTITSEFADGAIANWPTDLCPAPADGEQLGRGLQEIWQKWCGDDLACTPITVKKKNLDGTSSSKAIIIDDNSDDEIEKTTTPALPHKFRIPPAAGIVTPVSVDKWTTLFAKPAERDYEASSSAIARACSATEDNVTYPTPQSINKKKVIKACNTKAKKRPAIDSDLEPGDDDDDDDDDDDNMPIGPPTIASIRKRRSKIIYTDTPKYQICDTGDDEDYEYEQFEDDERLDERFASSCPVLETHPKRKRVKF